MHVSMYVGIYVCVYIYRCIYIYLYIYLYTHTTHGKNPEYCQQSVFRFINKIKGDRFDLQNVKYYSLVD